VSNRHREAALALSRGDPENIENNKCMSLGEVGGVVVAR